MVNGVIYTPTEEELQYVCDIPKVLSHKYHWHDSDEIESLANLGLAKGIPKYDSNRGMKFCDWIYWYCVREIKYYFSLSRNRNKLDALSMSDYEEVIEDKRKDRLDILEDTELARHLLNKISGLDKDIILLYLQGISHIDIATRLNLSAQSIRQRYSKAIIKLRNSSHVKKLKDKFTIKTWSETHPKEYRRATLKGTRKGRQAKDKKLKREKKLMGWEHLTLGECRVLCLMSDVKGRTVKEIGDNINLNKKYIKLLVYYLTKKGYLFSSRKHGYNCCLYFITDKAIKERKNGKDN